MGLLELGALLDSSILSPVCGIIDPPENQEELGALIPETIQVRNYSYQFSSIKNYSHTFSNNGNTVLWRLSQCLHLEKEPNSIRLKNWTYAGAVDMLEAKGELDGARS